MMRNFLLIFTLLFVACVPRQASQQSAGVANAATLAQMRFHCDSDTVAINRLLMDGMESGLTDANDLVAYYAHRLLGTPYVAHTLEGDTEALTINVHELDCTTFVETLYALARTTMNRRYSWRDYAANLENLRYRGGVMGDYSTRLHYISDWIVDNRMRGNLVEATPDLPHAASLIKDINFMSTHAASYRQLKGDSAMTAKIRNVEVGYRNHRIPYLKRTWLNDKNVKAALRSGDFIGLVCNIDGLDVSHMGIVIVDDKGDPYLLDASMSGGKVMLEEKPLYKYLDRSKTTIGIRIFRMTR